MGDICKDTLISNKMKAGGNWERQKSMLQKKAMVDRFPFLYNVISTARCQAKRDVWPQLRYCTTS